MILFDSLATFGPYPSRPRQEPWRLQSLLDDMDHYGIHAALVRHAQCFHHDAMQGNRRLIDEIAPHRRRLHPCWVVGPHHCGDYPAPEQLAGLLAESDVRAVQLCPGRHGYPPHADLLGELAEALNPRHTLVLVSQSDMGTDYEGWKRLCVLFHACPVVMTDSVWAQLRFIDACMRACDNLHLSFSKLQSNRAVEWMAGRYGIGRCLFGSGLPQMSGGAARGFVDWSFLDLPARQQYAGGNLARLLRIPLPSDVSVAAPADSIAAASRAGEAVPAAVLDAHCHVLEDGGCGVGTAYAMPCGDAAGILEVSARCGIAGIAMMTWQGPCGMDAAAGNELMARIVRAHKGRIIGLTSIDPLHQSREEMLAALAHCNLELGFRGIKPYWPQNQIQYNDAAYWPAWEFANQYGLYALLHTSGDKAGVGGVVEMAQRFPRASFVIPHSGGSWNYAELVAAACRQCPNVYAELTYTPVPNGIVEWLCEQAGQDRVLFGSDMPMRDPRPQLGWVVHSRLDDATKRMVLGGNFAAILRRSVLAGHTLPAIFSKDAQRVARECCSRTEPDSAGGMATQATA